MRLTLLLILFLFPLTLHAGQYLVETTDGNVSIVNYVEGSHDSLEDVLKEIGLTGQRIINAKGNMGPIHDFRYWKFNDVPIGPKIIIYEVRKQTDIVERQNKKSAAQDVLMKFCPTCTEEEFKTLLKEMRT